MNKKKYLIVVGLVILLSVGGTLAFFTSTSELENEFKSGRYKTVSIDNFISPSDWKPGDTTPKTITTKNEGTMPVRVRVKLTESWKSENNDDLPLEYNNEPVSIINFDNEEDWVKDGDYYYYIGDLAPGEETSSLIESITYNPNTPSDMTCTSNNGVYNCKSTGDGYDGGTYTLNVIVETVQSDLVLSAWNLSSDPTAERVVYTSGFDEYGTYEELDENVFLRKTRFGSLTSLQEVGFILNGNVYYLKGAGATYDEIGDYFNGDSIYYEENKTTLLNVFGSENCTDYDYYISCTDSSVAAEAVNSGHVYAEDSSISCHIYSDGYSECILSYN